MSVFLNILILSTAILLQGCLKRDPVQSRATSGSSGACYINQTSSSPNEYLSLGQTGGTLTTTKIAQGFSVNTTATMLATAEIWIKKIKKPGGYLFVSIQENSGGTPDGLPIFINEAEQKKINGLPDGTPIYGGIFKLSSLPESTNPQRISVNLDHGTLAKKSDKQSRSLAASTDPTISLGAGKYWLVVEFKGPANPTDYVQWGSYTSNPIKDAYALTYLENFAKRTWSFAQTGADRDMSFSIGCKND